MQNSLVAFMNAAPMVQSRRAHLRDFLQLFFSDLQLTPPEQAALYQRSQNLRSDMHSEYRFTSRVLSSLRGNGRRAAHHITRMWNTANERGIVIPLLNDMVSGLGPLMGLFFNNCMFL